MIRHQSTVGVKRCCKRNIGRWFASHPRTATPAMSWKGDPVPRLRFAVGVITAMLFALAGFVAMGESPDLERAYAWLGLGFAGLTMVVALPTRRDMA